MKLIIFLIGLVMLSCVPRTNSNLDSDNGFEDCDCCEDIDDNEYDDNFEKYNQWAG